MVKDDVDRDMSDINANALRGINVPISFHPLLVHLPAWMLVLFRLTGIFFYAPVFGSRAVPARVKILLALGLSFCVYPMLLAPGSRSVAMITPLIDSGLGLWALVGSVAAELLVGIVIGYGASLPLIGLQVGGRMVDQQLGLGLAGVLNPEFNEETGLVSQFYFVTGLALFVILGGHRVMLVILVGSFAKIPLGGLAVDGHLLDLVLAMVSTVFELALRVSAPLLCILFLQTVAMGFIARTVPQMNILSIGFVVRILVGSAVIIGAIGIQYGVYRQDVERVLGQLQQFLAG